MENLSTLQALVQRLESLKHKECLLQLEQAGLSHWSGAQVAETARQLARGLVEAGVKPGEVVTILAHNRPEWVIAALGITSAGAVISPLDSQIRPEALERVLTDSQPRFIFTTTDYLNRLQQVELEPQPRLLLFDVESDDKRSWRALLSTASTPLPQVEPADQAALFYTSGTTGVPKGVPLTHHNLVFQIQAVGQANLLKDDDRVLLPLPMYHVYPFTVGTLTPLAFGLPIVLPQSLTGPQIIRALNEGEITIIIGVPRVYRAVYSGIENQIEARGKLAAAAFNAALQTSIKARRRFGWQIGRTLFRPVRARLGPHVRLLASGGSALDPELAWKLEGLGWNVGIGYGLTETSPMLTMNLPNDQVPRLASVGPALTGVEIRIDPTVQTEDEDRPANGHGVVEGEIQARGAGVFSGYRNLPDQTAEAFTADGWFRTGDLGYVDDDGYLYISGRASTLIVLEGGKKIQPEPLEEIYEQHQFIRELGVLYQANQLVALIVPEIEAINRLRNGDLEAAIREAVNDRVKAVASYQRLTDYAISDQPLPRTNLGKIRRHLLQQSYNEVKQGLARTDTTAAGPLPLADMSEQDQTLLSEPAAGQVWEWLAQRYAQKRLTPDTSPQLELGVDSLEWLTLTLRVSELTGVELSDEAIGRISTIRELLQEVVDAAGREAVVPAATDDPEALLTEEQKQWLRPLSPIQEKIFAVLFPLYQSLVRLLFRVKVHGLENLPGDRNFVLTPNHTSMLDAPLVAAVLPSAQMRQTHWAGATEIMLANPIMRLISRLAQVLPIDRYGGGTGAKNLTLAIAALSRDKNLVWFPEGRITTTGEMLPFREGIGIMLDRQPVAAVPVYIQGAREAMPVEATFPKLKPVTIVFGPACDPTALAQEGEGETAPARIARALQARVAALAEQAPAPSAAEGGLPTRQQVISVAALAVGISAVLGAIWYMIRRRRK